MSTVILSARPRTDKKRRAFCKALAETGNVKASCERAGLDQSQVYKDRMKNKAFAEVWAEAQAIAEARIGDELEQEAYRRAMEGNEEPLMYQGRKVGSVRRPSDTLTIFLLKGAKPEKYGDRVRPEQAANVSININLGGKQIRTADQSMKNVTPKPKQIEALDR